MLSVVSRIPRCPPRSLVLCTQLHNCQDYKYDRVSLLWFGFIAWCNCLSKKEKLSIWVWTNHPSPSNLGLEIGDMGTWGFRMLLLAWIRGGQMARIAGSLQELRVCKAARTWGLNHNKLTSANNQEGQNSPKPTDNNWSSWHPDYSPIILWDPSFTVHAELLANETVSK